MRVYLFTFFSENSISGTKKREVRDFNKYSEINRNSVRSTASSRSYLRENNHSSHVETTSVFMRSSIRKLLDLSY